MIKRYLFRGKEKLDGEWIYGDYIYAEPLDTHFIVEHNGFRQFSDECFVFTTVIPETVGQCTGLRDKNGKFIFEGDITKHRSNYSDNAVIAVVTYTDCHFLALVDEHSGFELSDKLEVVGNKWDNPELLEVE